jgi:hypothetical protein
MNAGEGRIPRRRRPKPAPLPPNAQRFITTRNTLSTANSRAMSAKPPAARREERAEAGSGGGCSGLAGGESLLPPPNTVSSSCHHCAGVSCWKRAGLSATSAAVSAATIRPLTSTSARRMRVWYTIHHPLLHDIIITSHRVMSSAEMGLGEWKALKKVGCVFERATKKRCGEKQRRRSVRSRVNGSCAESLHRYLLLLFLMLDKNLSPTLNHTKAHREVSHTMPHAIRFKFCLYHVLMSQMFASGCWV